MLPFLCCIIYQGCTEQQERNAQVLTSSKHGACQNSASSTPVYISPSNTAGSRTSIRSWLWPLPIQVRLAKQNRNVINHTDIVRQEVVAASSALPSERVESSLLYTAKGKTTGAHASLPTMGMFAPSHGNPYRTNKANWQLHKFFFDVCLSPLA